MNHSKEAVEGAKGERCHLCHGTLEQCRDNEYCYMNIWRQEQRAKETVVCAEATARVLVVYPDAKSKHFRNGEWHIMIDGDLTYIGTGDTEDEAWLDASFCIKDMSEAPP